MSQEESIQIPPSPRPITNDPEVWETYWKVQGQSWRTESEIPLERQEELTQCRAIVPNIEKGIYPFKDIKLSRADIEWLLATHENGRGPVDWGDEQQRERKGLDLRGGLTRDEWSHTNPWQRHVAEIHLEQADLSGGHLEGASLRRANLQRMNLYHAHLEMADCMMANLEGALLQGAHPERTNLRRAYLAKSNLLNAHLEGTQLRQTALDSQTILENVVLNSEKFGCALLADVGWNGANLAVVKWSNVKVLGNEYEARQKRLNGQVKDRETRLEEFEIAVRANRQLAVELQGQGLNEEAARFAYRAQKLQREVVWRQRKIGQYLFSLFLAVLAGYGYKPIRSVIWYLVFIFGFAMAYFVFGHLPLLPDALIFSLTSFHGRGFFPGLEHGTSLHDPLVMLAALEAVVGLFIEISFIATFTQRFFGK